MSADEKLWTFRKMRAEVHRKGRRDACRDDGGGKRRDKAGDGERGHGDGNAYDDFARTGRHAVVNHERKQGRQAHLGGRAHERECEQRRHLAPVEPYVSEDVQGATKIR